LARKDRSIVAQLCLSHIWESLLIAPLAAKFEKAENGCK